MNNRTKTKILTDWKLFDAFNRGVADQLDNEVWLSTLNTSSFRTGLNYYTDIDKIYQGMLENINYYVNNCSPKGLLDLHMFYQNQTGIVFKELYLSSVNTFNRDVADVKERDRVVWWEGMFEDFRYDYTKAIV